MAGTDRWLNTPYEDELQPDVMGRAGQLSELGWSSAPTLERIHGCRRSIGSHCGTSSRGPEVTSSSGSDPVRVHRVSVWEL